MKRFLKRKADKPADDVACLPKQQVIVLDSSEDEETTTTTTTTIAGPPALCSGNKLLNPPKVLRFSDVLFKHCSVFFEIVFAQQNKCL